MERIVVGVDGSDESRAALRWALAEAQLRHASLEVVHVWEPAYAGAYPFAMPPYDMSAIEHGARLLVDSVLEHEDLTDLDAPVVRTIVCGSAAAVLVDHSAGATLVVVGARGHGGFSRLLVGSTSTQLVHHAACPVVVVRR